LHQAQYSKAGDVYCKVVEKDVRD